MFWLLLAALASAEDRVVCGWVRDGASFILDRHTAEDLAEDERRDAELEMREPNYASIPPGGTIVVQAWRKTLDALEPSFYATAFTDAAGGVIERYQPTVETREIGTVPGSAAGPGGFSMAFKVVVPPGAAAVWVSDTALDRRCGASLLPDGSIKRIKE